MTNQEYVAAALKTETLDLDGIRNRVTPITIRLLHGALGLAGEAGEFADAIKKHVFYGAPCDMTNLIEELGDILWYCVVVMDTLDLTFEEVQKKNVAKLQQRYGGAFSLEKVLNRDTAAEREALEKGR